MFIYLMPICFSHRKWEICKNSCKRMKTYNGIIFMCLCLKEFAVACVWIEFFFAGFDENVMKCLKKCSWLHHVVKLF